MSQISVAFCFVAPGAAVGLWTAAACCRFPSNSLLLDDELDELLMSYLRQQAAADQTSTTLAPVDFADWSDAAQLRLIFGGFDGFDGVLDGADSAIVDFAAGEFAFLDLFVEGHDHLSELRHGGLGG